MTNEVVNNAAVETDKTKEVGKKVIILVIILVAVSIIVQFGIICFMLLGVVNVYGAPLNVVNVVKNIINIVNIKRGKIYKTLIKLALGIMYIVMLVVMTKNIIRTLKSLPKVKSSLLDPRYSDIYRIYDKAISACFYAVMTIFIAYLLSESELNAVSYGVIALFCATYISASIIFAFIRKKEKFTSKVQVGSFVFVALRSVVFSALLIVMSVLVMQPSVNNLAYGVQVIFGGYFKSGFVGVLSTLYDYVVRDILDVVAAVILFCIIRTAIEGIGAGAGFKGYDGKIKRYCNTLIGVITASAVIECVIIIINLSTNGTELSMSTVTSLFSVLRLRFLPIIITAVAGTIFASGVFERDAENATVVTAKAK